MSEFNAELMRQEINNYEMERVERFKKLIIESIKRRSRMGINSLSLKDKEFEGYFKLPMSEREILENFFRELGFKLMGEYSVSPRIISW